MTVPVHLLINILPVLTDIRLEEALATENFSVVMLRLAHQDTLPERPAAPVIPAR